MGDVRSREGGDDGDGELKGREIHVDGVVVLGASVAGGASWRSAGCGSGHGVDVQPAAPPAALHSSLRCFPLRLARLPPACAQFVTYLILPLPFPSGCCPEMLALLFLDQAQLIDFRFLGGALERAALGGFS